MATVAFAQQLKGIQSVPSGQVPALAQLLQRHLPAAVSVVIDASEGEGRTLADIVTFLTAGGVWVSWGGYPFYYTPSQPGGLGYNFSRFCKLAGVPDPNPKNVGSEFFAPPNGSKRGLWTPTPTLPSPWVADPAYPPKAVGNAYVWGAVAVPVGAGWWFYASTDYGPVTADQYAAFVLSLTAPHPSQQKPIGLPVWAIAAGGTVVVGGLIAIEVATNRR